MTVSETAPSPEVQRTVLRRLALNARGMSGADVERLVREARQTARRAGRALSFADVFDRLAARRPVLSPALRERMAIHEAGHAVAELDLGSSRIDVITIADADGGRVEGEATALEAETEERFERQLVTRLAGRAAEAELLGSVTAGAGGGPGSDLAMATRLALAMETVFGFAADQPLLHQAIDDMGTQLAWNPKLADRVNARLAAAYDRACQLVRDNAGAVRHLAEALLAHDTLEGPELNVILKKLSPPK